MEVSIKLRKTIFYLKMIFFIGWNIHTVQATIGPDVYDGVNTLTTEIIACFGDMVAKCLFCLVATILRIQVSGSWPHGLYWSAWIEA